MQETLKIIFSGEEHKALSEVRHAISSMPGVEFQMIPSPILASNVLRNAALLIVPLEPVPAEALEMASRIRSEVAGTSIPILFLSEFDPAEEVLHKIYSIPRSDHFRWRRIPEALKAKVRFFTELFRMNRIVATSPGKPSTDADMEESKARSRLQLLMESPCDYGFFFTDTHGMIVEWSSGAEAITGYSESEVRGMYLDLIFTDRDRADGIPGMEMQTAMEKGQARDERWHLKKDGSRFYAYGRLVALRDDEDKLCGFAKILRDATLYQQTQHELRINLERLRLATEATGVGTWEMDLSSPLIHWSNQTRNLFECSPHDVITHDFFLSRVHPEDRDRLRRLMEETSSSPIQQQVETEYRILLPEKRIRWIAAKAFPVMDFPNQPPTRLVGTVVDITAQREADEKLREREQRFRAVFNQQFQFMAILSPEGRVLEINDLPLLTTSISRDQVVGNLFWETPFWAHLPEMKKAWPERLEKAAQTDGPVLTEDEFEALDGSIRIALAAVTAVKTPEGGVDFFIIQASDITERKRAEHALRESEAKLRALVNNTDSVIYMKDLEGRCLLANLSFGKMLDSPIPSIEGKTDYDLFPAHIADHFKAHDRKVLESGEEQEFEEHVGSRVYLSRKFPLRKNNGEIYAICGINTDITERKAAEKSLSYQKAALQSVAETILDAILLVSPDGEILYYNTQFRTLWNFPQKILDSKSDTKALAWASQQVDDPEDFLRKVRDAYSNPQRKVREELHFRDGRVFDRYGAPVKDSEGHYYGWAWFFREITEQKMIEKRLKNWSIELEERVRERTASLNEKTAQLESFCYTVAHDLRAPLRAITGYTDFILEDFRHLLAEEGQDYVFKIQTAAKRMDTLINDLLSYSRVVQLDYRVENLDLQTIFDLVIQQLRPEIMQSNAEVHIQPKLPKVRADKSILEQILTNLLSNSLKFVQKGKRPVIQVSTEERENVVSIIIQDNGIGIDPQYQDRIFKVFERLHTSTDFPGTGVGLAIVAKGIEKLGGKVGVKSLAGEGSTFWIELQRAI